jgi:hypothetical protein
MSKVDVFAVSQALDQAHVWHRIENNFIITKRTSIKIPQIDEKVAYFAGVVTGDGNVNTCKRKKGGYYYRVNVVGRKEYLEQLSILIKNLFNYQPSILKDKRKKNCYYINIHSAAVYFFFIKLGFHAGKKRNLRVPRLIAENAILFKHYMRGLIDTDGSVLRRRVQLKQREREFLKELVRLLKTHLDIISNPPKVNFTDGKPYYYIRFPIDNIQVES